jgi:hypothetical protein
MTIPSHKIIKVIIRILEFAASQFRKLLEELKEG